jgi:hypothetical protein
MDIELARANRRYGGRRWNVVWPASIAIEGQTLACTILDLSSTGARIEGYGLRPVSSVAVLECEKFGTLTARVKWVRGGKAGLRFDRPSGEIMEKLRSVVPGMGRREAPRVSSSRANFGRRRAVAA